jgi:hypothetical protein
MGSWFALSDGPSVTSSIVRTSFSPAGVGISTFFFFGPVGD